MFVRKRIDYFLITFVFLVLAIDLVVYLFSPSILIPIVWATFSLVIKGFICCWNHHHQHCKFFTLPWANRLLELIMGLQTGIVGEAWVLHHTLGHHINYLDQSKDESAWKTSSGRIMSQLEYTLKVGIMAYPKAFVVGERYPKSRDRLTQNILLTTLVLGLLSWFDWRKTLIMFIIPMVVLLFMTVNETYHHHTGLDQENPYAATYNITDRWYNFFTCNLGYHTAHHVQCGRHWSDLPQFHEDIKERIPSHLYRDPGFPFTLMTQVEKIFSRQPQKC